MPDISKTSRLVFWSRLATDVVNGTSNVISDRICDLSSIRSHRQRTAPPGGCHSHPVPQQCGGSEIKSTWRLRINPNTAPSKAPFSTTVITPPRSSPSAICKSFGWRVHRKNFIHNTLQKSRKSTYFPLPTALNLATFPTSPILHSSHECVYRPRYKLQLATYSYEIDIILSHLF